MPKKRAVPSHQQIPNLLLPLGNKTMYKNAWDHNNNSYSNSDNDKVIFVDSVSFFSSSQMYIVHMTSVFAFIFKASLRNDNS